MEATYLICIPNCTIQTIDVCKKKDTAKETNPVDQAKLRRDDLNTLDTRALLSKQRDRVWISTRVMAGYRGINGIRGIRVLLIYLIPRHVGSESR